MTFTIFELEIRRIKGLVLKLVEKLPIRIVNFATCSSKHIESPLLLISIDMQCEVCDDYNTHKLDESLAIDTDELVES